MIMIICFCVMMIIMTMIRIRTNVLRALVLFLCFNFFNVFRIFFNLLFNIGLTFSTTFSNFGLIFFQSQSKTLLIINLTTYCLMKFTINSIALSEAPLAIQKNDKWLPMVVWRSTLHSPHFVRSFLAGKIFCRNTSCCIPEPI